MESVDPAIDQPTRQRVARSILVNGPSTAAALAERLDLTSAAVRRHLDQLLAEGAVEARDPRVATSRGRGRPAKLFALTEHGRDGFEAQYDDLANEALRFLSGGSIEGVVLNDLVTPRHQYYGRYAIAEPPPVL